MRTSIIDRLSSIDDDHQWELADTALDTTIAVGANSNTIVSYQTHTKAAGYGEDQQRNPNAHRHLGRSMEFDVANNKALRCSVVVNKKWGMPGEQYFEKARSLGFTIAHDRDAERTFWEGQMQKLGFDATRVSIV
jgi:hypothetical protein